VRALSDGGKSNVLYDMLSRTDKPSYLQQIQNGATALTEAWDSWREASQNHFMLGHAETWFFEGLGGVQVDHSRTDGPALRLAPQYVVGIASSSVHMQTVLGAVFCQLETRDRRATVTVERDLQFGRTRQRN
jgi:alpha-L-rhamnosidase